MSKDKDNTVKTGCHLKSIVAFIFLIASLGGCTEKRTPPAPSLPSSVDDYAVYAVLIDSLYLRKGITRVVIRESTLSRSSAPIGRIRVRNRDTGRWRTLDRYARLRSMLAMAYPTVNLDRLITRFTAANVVSYRLAGPSFPVDATVILLSRDAFQAFFTGSGDGWARFHARYPHADGILRFSRVAFDYERGLALVYMERETGPSKGAGTWVLLAHAAQGWRMVFRFAAWGA